MKHKRRIGHMTRLQWKIFCSQLDKRDRKETKRYLSSVLWGMGYYGGRRKITRSIANKMLPRNDSVEQIMDRLKRAYKVLLRNQKNVT